MAKLVITNGVIISTFKKDRWCIFRGPGKFEGTPNKKKTYTGTLHIRPSAHPAPVVNSSCGAKDRDNKANKNANIIGTHSRDLTEEAIAFTC